MSDFTRTTNYNLYKPVSGADDDAWGDHWNWNADTLDSTVHGMLPLTGGTVTAATGVTALTVNASNTQTAADHIYNSFTSTANYTANAVGGDNLAFTSNMAMRPNGHTVSSVSGHSCAIYGNGFLDNDGNAASNLAWINGVMGVTGNGGPGTLSRGVDFFGHPCYNTGGGTFANHYFLYQEPSTTATNDYGAYFSAPVGIGTPTPTYNLDINCNAAGNVISGNGLHVDFGGTGTLFVTRTGMSIFPGFNPGAGGFGCVDLMIGNNGSANALTATSGFLYLARCAGTPTGAPTWGAFGCPMQVDTVANKLWVYVNSAWKGVVLT